MSANAPSSSSPQLAGGCLVVMLVFGWLVGLGIVAGGVSLLRQVPAAWREMQEIWTEAPGTVLASRVASREVRTGTQPKNYRSSTLYFVQLDYEYTVEGRKLTGTSPAARQQEGDGNMEQALEVAATYKPGDPVPAYYDPQDVNRSRLIPDGPNGMFWFGAVGGPLLVLSGLGLCVWCWKDWKAKR